MHKIKQRVILPNAEIGDTAGRLRLISGVPLVKVSTIPGIERAGMPMIRDRILVAGHSFTITAANDYGGAKIIDFPNTNMAIFGFLMNVVGTITAPNVGTDLTLSLGTAVAGATPLATTAIDYMTAKTGVGAAQAFTAVGHSFDGGASVTTAPLFLDNSASANDLFLNGAAAVASGTCTVTFTAGYIDMYWFDMAEPVALA